ncbi:MAG: MraY family glycosyltransferase [Desulfobacteraceae bacterium]
MIYLSTLLMSWLLTLSLIPFFKHMALVHNNALDIPCERKIHQKAVPKIGGLAMALGILFPSLVWISSDQMVNSILAGSAVIVIFGFYDDLKECGCCIKFLGQAIAAAVVVGLGGVTITSLGDLLPVGMLLPAFISIPLTLITIVGVTNAVNLSDGLDGLAGGISILCFVCIFYLAYSLGMPSLAVLSIAVIGALLGFLRLNTHPASIFMGDTGSQLLGFLAVTLSIYISQSSKTVISPLFPLILLGIPILDTLTVMIGRMIRGESPFKADRSHLHHKLMNLGLHHLEVVFVLYVLQAVLVSMAFLLRFHSERVILIFYLAFSFTLLGFFYWVQKTGWTLTRIGKECLLPIRLPFLCLTYGFCMLLIFSCIVPRSFPNYVLFGLFVIISILFLAEKIRDDVFSLVLRICFYIALPFVMFFIEVNSASWMGGAFKVIYNGAFGLITLFMILTLKNTRRKRGFKIKPFDFIILFVSLGFLNYFSAGMKGLNLITLSVHIFVCLFAYEVVSGELRNGSRFLIRSTLAMFFLLFIRIMGMSF